MHVQSRHNWILFGITLSLVLPLTGSVISTLFFNTSRFAHLPIHSLMEAVGGLMAVSIACILAVEQTRKQEVHHYHWMAGALVGMGVLDLFHSAVNTGNNFVWLHSIATFIGGLLFSLVWLGNRGQSPRFKKLYPWWVFAGALLIGVFSCLFTSSIPTMAVEGHFTVLARGLNVGGGLGFLIAGVFFVSRFHRNYELEDWLFAAHTMLFGVAGILFELSALWDAAWWWWHILRLIAYLAAFVYAIRAYLEAEHAVITMNRQLHDKNKILDQLNFRMNEELDIAVALQSKLYPQSDPHYAGFDIAGSVFPSKKGCGDYFDFIPMPKETLGVVVGDVSGHGIGPAMVMVETRALLRYLAQQNGSQQNVHVDRIVAKLNDLIVRDIAEMNFVTLFMLSIDYRHGSFEYSGAGHDGILLRRNGEVEELASTALPLGVIEKPEIGMRTLTIQAGDVIALLTDGLAETFSPEGELFGTKRIIQKLRSMRDKPAEEIVQTLYNESREFAGYAEQEDDIAVVIMKCYRN